MPYSDNTQFRKRALARTIDSDLDVVVNEEVVKALSQLYHSSTPSKSSETKELAKDQSSSLPPPLDDSERLWKDTIDLYADAFEEMKPLIGPNEWDAVRYTIIRLLSNCWCVTVFPYDHSEMIFSRSEQLLPYPGIPEVYKHCFYNYATAKEAIEQFLKAVQVLAYKANLDNIAGVTSILSSECSEVTV